MDYIPTSHYSHLHSTNFDRIQRMQILTSFITSLEITTCLHAYRLWCDDVLLLILVEPSDSLHRDVVTLCSSACEHNFLWVGLYQRRYLLQCSQWHVLLYNYHLNNTRTRKVHTSPEVNLIWIWNLHPQPDCRCRWLEKNSTGTSV